jgi:hypothetical protein
MTSFLMFIESVGLQECRITNIYFASYCKLIRGSDDLCRFSPYGNEAAYSVEKKLNVLNTLTFDQCPNFSCDRAIEVSYHCCFYEEITVSFNFRSSRC